MKLPKTKGIIKAALCIVLLLGALLSLVSCTSEEQNLNAETVTREMVFAIIDGDLDRAYSLFNGKIEKAKFISFFEEVTPFFEGFTSPGFKQVGWHVAYENGISAYTVVFEVTEGEDTVMVSSQFLTEDDTLYYINIVPATTLSAAEVIPLQIVMAIVSLAVLALMIWLVVDCSKSNINKKGWWILLILAGIHVSVSFGAEFDFDFGITLVNLISTASANGVLATVKFVLPVGAIIYLFMRKKLKASAPVEQPPMIEPEFVDVTETEAENGVTDADKEQNE